MEAPLEGAGLSWEGAAGRERLSRDFAVLEEDADPACFFIRARSSAWREAIAVSPSSRMSEIENRKPFQTHFLNVWRRKWPSPSGSMCLKFRAYPFFSIRLIQLFSTRTAHRVTSPKNISLQKL